MPSTPPRRSPDFRRTPSRFPQHQIDDPAPPHVRPRAAAVAQDVLVVAPGVLQCIREDGHAIEGTVDVNRLREGDHGGRSPLGGERDWAERIAEDFSHQIAKGVILTVLCFGRLRSIHLTSSSTIRDLSDFSLSAPRFFSNSIGMGFVT